MQIGKIGFGGKLNTKVIRGGSRWRRLLYFFIDMF